MKKKNRRLTNILLVCGLTTIFAVPSIITKDLAKPVFADATTQNYSLHAAATDQVENGSTTVQRKASMQNSNMAINLKGTFYYNQQSANYTGHPEYWYINNSTYDPNIYSYDSQGMLAVEITPYNLNTNTQITLQIHLNIIANYITPRDTDAAIRIDSYRYISTQSNLSWLLNRMDWNTTGKVYEWRNSLESPSNAYIYTKSIDHTFLGYVNDLQGQVITKTFTYTINVSTETMYFIWYFFPTYAENEQLQQESYYASGNGAKMTTADGITVNGTMIIPTGSYEVIDIGGLMFTILTMPFSFISQAFNLTLFPNTPYAINISNLFITIIAVMLFVWLLSIIIKLFIGK